MNINKNSWHYKVWNHYTANVFHINPNFCEYTRTIFIKAPVCLLLILVFSVFLAATQLAIAIPLLIIGYRPGLKEFWASGDYDQRFIVPYSGLKIKRKLPNFPFELYPWHVLLPVVLVIAQWALIHYDMWPIEGVCAGVVVAALIAAYFAENGDTETVRLLKAKFAAKKQMICPLITFTDEPTKLDED
jgi:hypothetical protein